MLPHKHAAVTPPGQAVLWHEHAGQQPVPTACQWPADMPAPCSYRCSLSPIDLQETDDSFIIYVYVASKSADKLVLTVRGQMVAIRNLDHYAACSGVPGQDNWYGGSSFSCLLPDCANCETARMLRENGRITITIDKC